MPRFLSGRQKYSNIGINSYTESKTVLQTIGKVGIGTTDSQNYSLFVLGPTNITSNLNVGGASTFVGVGTFNNDLYVDGVLYANSLNIPGGSNISEDLTTRNLTVTGFSTFALLSKFNSGIDVTDHTELDDLNVSGIATIHTLDVSTNFDVYDSQAVFHNNLFIAGNLSIGGTTTAISTQDLRVFDKEITLGIATDAFGNDVSNDITANHGGIAIASTEGSPLVDLTLAGFSTLPSTYKQLMWVAANSYGFGTTDAWMFNYAVGIGSTLVPNNVRLAVSNIKFTDNDIYDVENINVSDTITSANLIVNSLTSTGTTSQPLQVTGGAYISGNLGIGTTNPTTNLDVNGGLRLHGVLFDNDNESGIANQVLISTGNGVDWVDAAPVGAITGITVKDEGTIIGIAASINTLDFVGANVTATSIGSTAIITINDYVSVAGVSTYANISGLATYASVSGVTTALQFARNISLTGDVVGSILFDGTQNVSIAATIQPDSVGLGTDTFGEYVAAIVDSGFSDIEVNNSGTETATVTLGLTTTGVISGSYGSTTEIPTFTVDSRGRLISAGSTALATTLNIAGNTGADSLSLLTDTLTAVGGTHVSVAVTDNTFTINTDATSENVSGTLVARNSSGGFSAGGIIATDGNFSGIVTTFNLSVSGVSTLGFTTVTNLFAQSINSSGIVTASQFSTGLSGIGINIDSNTISGPSEIIIDPSVVGDDTGLVRIKGNLFVDGAQTIINSTTIELADFNVGIATTVTSDILLDGAGIGIGDTSIRKTLSWNYSSSSLKSSENFDLLSSKTYKIDGVNVLTATTLGSGVTESSLTSVGTLSNLNVGDVYSTGIITATKFVGSIEVTGIGNSAVIDYLSGIDFNYSGIGTVGSVTISGISGIITSSNPGITTVVYYGDGSNLTGVTAFYVENQDITSDPVYPTFASNTGVSTVGIATTGLVYIPSKGNLGIGTTNPTSTLTVEGDGLFAGIVTAQNFSGNLLGSVIGDIASVTNLNVSGISTLGNVVLTGSVNAGSTIGTNGQYLQSTGIGVTWKDFPTFRTTSTQIAIEGQSVFNFIYNINYLDVFVNGGRLTGSEYVATNGTSVTLNSSAFENDVVEFVSYNTISTGTGYIPTLLNDLSDVSVSSLSPGENLTYNGSIWTNDYTVTASTSTTSQTDIHTLNASSYRSVEYMIQATRGSEYHVTKVLAVHNGTSASNTSYGTVYTGSSLASFAVDISGGNLRLLVTPSSASLTSYKIKFTPIKI
jgi:hypothetical protein